MVLEKGIESIVDGEKDKLLWIIENIKPEWTLESRLAKAALSYFGHVARAGVMEDDVMLGIMNGARKRGRPIQRWLDTLKGYSSGATISNMRRDARDKAGWRGATTAVSRGRMLFDGTRCDETACWLFRNEINYAVGFQGYAFANLNSYVRYY